MFMVLVIFHELGHFIAAKKSGVKVLEFGIGMPPKVCKIWTDKSGTVYTLNLIPLGGFVRLKGEDPKDEADFKSNDSFIMAKLRKKIIILLAGVSMNFLVAWGIFTFIFTAGTQPISVLPENTIASETNSYLMPTITFLDQQWFISGELIKTPAKVTQVASNLLGQQMGLRSWDTILTINNNDVDVRNIGTVLKDNIGKDITVRYMRNHTTANAKAHCPEDNCLLGITFSAGNINLKPIQFSFPQAIKAGLQEVKAQTILTFHTLGTFGRDLLSFDGARIKTSVNKLTGPAGVIKVGESLLSTWGRKLFLGFAGMISLALAIFNVLPIPALDGGRLLWVIIQGAGKLKPEKYFTIEGYINFVFFIALMGLWIYILLKDLVRFRHIGIPFIS